MAEIKKLARAQNTILGRTIEFPKADGYALYIVTKVNKRTVELTWIRYSDAWIDNRLGYQGSLDKTYVERYVNSHDQLAEEFYNSLKNQQ